MTPEEEQKLLTYKGFDPAKYQVDYATQTVVPRPQVTATEVSHGPDKPESSWQGSLARNAATSIAPTLASLGTLGATLTLAGGGASTTGVGAVPGIPTMVLGAILSAAAGYGASKLQEPLLSESFKKQLAADAEQHPVASGIGQLAPNLLGSKLQTPGNLVKIVRGLNPRTVDTGAKLAARNAAANVGLEMGVGAGLREASGGDALDLKGALWDAVGGAAFGAPRNNVLTRKLGLAYPDNDKYLADIVSEAQAHTTPFNDTTDATALRKWDATIHGGEKELEAARKAVIKKHAPGSLTDELFEDALVRQAERNKATSPTGNSVVQAIKAKLPLKTWDPTIHGDESVLTAAKKSVDAALKGKAVDPAAYEDMLVSYAEKKAKTPQVAVVSSIQAKIAARKQEIASVSAKAAELQRPPPVEVTPVQEQIAEVTGIDRTTDYVPLSAEEVANREFVAQENRRLAEELQQQKLEQQKLREEQQLLRQQQEQLRLERQQAERTATLQQQLVPEPESQPAPIKGKIRNIPSWADRTSESSSVAPSASVVAPSKEVLTEGMYNLVARHFGPIQGTEVKRGAGPRPDVKGFTDTDTATITPAATPDTPFHEVAGHAFLNKGLREPTVAPLVNDLYTELGKTQAYKDWSIQASAAGTDPSVKEYAAQLLGERLATDLKGSKYKTTAGVKYQLNVLMKEFKRLFKNANADDITELVQHAFTQGEGARLSQVKGQTVMPASDSDEVEAVEQESSAKAPPVTVKPAKEPSRVPSVTRSSIDSIRREGPAGDYLADKLVAQRQDQVALNGRWRNKAAEALGELSGSQQKQVDALLSERNPFVPPVLRKAYSTLKSLLKDTHDEQRKRGLPVMAFDSKGEVYRRAPEDDPTYNPNIISSKVYDELINHPESAKAKSLREDFLNHFEKIFADAADPRAQAEKRLQQMFPKRGGGVSVDYNAVRLAEGSGLPKSWLETNDIQGKWRRYFTKFGADLSYFTNLQSDPATRQLLNITDDGLGDTTKADTLPDGTSIKGITYETNPHVIAALHDAVGGRQLLPNQILALSRLANAVTVGPLGRVRDIASVPGIASEIAGPGSMLAALPKALASVSEGIREATRRGLIDQSQVTWHDRTLDEMDSWVDKAADIVNKYTGSQQLERVARGFTWILGKTIAEANLVNPQFVRRFGGVADANVIADRITEQIQGTYDARGTPTWMRESAFGPLFSLNRWSFERFNNWKKNVFDEAAKGNLKPLIGNAFGIVAGSAAIDFINEEVRRAKPEHLTWKEFLQLDGADAPYKLASALSISGTTGVLGDLVLTTLNLAEGRKPRGTGMPLLEITANIAERLGQFTAAESLDFPALVHQIAKDNIQVYRDLIPKDPNRDAKRDVRIYKRLTGDAVSANFTGNPFENTEAKEIMTSNDSAEVLAKLVSSIVAGSKEPGKKLDSLKRSLAQNDNSFVEDNEFYQMLVKMHGKEEALKRLKDYLTQQAKRKTLSSLVP